ncbi:MAG TPA: DUF1579 domain-containing protein [Rudaea sp.]|jgi:hypothetical protein|nr:DUF1579 domain-containing protein [Rudaea sp.]
MKAIHTFQLLALTGALTVACTAATAQDTQQPAMSKEQKAMMDAMQREGEVRPEHKQLDYFVGDWGVTTTMFMDPKAPPQKTEGKTHTESLFGGRYVKMKFDGSFEGQAFNGEGMLGFDNTSGKFFNTWIDSMSTGFWLAWGSYDSASKTYTFRGQMDDPMKPGAKFAVRETVRVVDPTHYSFDWYETHGGKEGKTMQIDYTKR